MMEIVFALALLALGAATFFWFGWEVRGIKANRELTERMDAERSRRRNVLTDRGRTTDRRPEHDDEPPSRMGRVRFRGSKLPPPDRPANE